MLGLGLIGAGAFGRFISLGVNRGSGFDVVAVADTDQRAARSIASQHGASAYADYRALLKDPRVEVVWVNTPHQLHEKMVLASLDAQKHVFCEKPLALTGLGVREIFRQAHTVNRLVGIDYVLRMSTLYQTVARSAARFGELKVLTINHQSTEGTITTPWYWDERRSGGWFVTSAFHFFDLINVFAHNAQPVHVAPIEYRDARTGRTRAIAAQVAYRDGQQLNLYHDFTAGYRAASTVALLDFDRAHVRITDWVPTAMTINDRWYTLAWSREVEYHKMVMRGLRELATAIRQGKNQHEYQDPQLTLRSHLIAFAAARRAKVRTI